ncbi:hypothetical protein Ddye_022506 [Dipteronia dyeriana]|uniref:Uncharacterized protein n=1 Tax=Dipteronia dyeriana TaxID=168575 RepID=A0AAD9WSE5_9ROSI|nr:hypothetical protein Ddye_022506 [Dipteronia dyeriana]
MGEDKKELLRSYGLNPDEFISEPSSKIKGRKELMNKGRGAKFVSNEEPKEKESREIHRLLQGLGGKAKRKKLICPKGMNVRPMMEFVKGATFDSLEVAGGCPASLRPGHWLDLYSRTESVGIKAIKMDHWVVSNIFQPNLELTGCLNFYNNELYLISIDVTYQDLDECRLR